LNLKQVHKVGSYFAYYLFAVIILSALLIHKDYRFLDAPPPAPPGQIYFPVLSQIASRILWVHLLTLWFYLVVSLPVLTYVTIKLVRIKEENKKGIIIRYVLYLLITLLTLFWEELERLIR